MEGSVIFIKKGIAAACLLIILSASVLAAQPNQKVLDYIDQYKAIAIKEMITFKIPASITMAQGILESGAGQSELAKQSNNHFGIKCHNDWTGDKVYYDDDAKDECFRKYDHVEESYHDHSTFLVNKPRYAALFELELTDYKGWAKGLKAAGYATNPKYADLLINLIEEYHLDELDKMTLADIKKEEKQEKHDNKTNDPVTTTQQTDNSKNTNKKFSWAGYSEEVFYFNRIPTVTLEQGDSPESLAKKHHIKLNLLKDYNDIERGEPLTPGTKFYLQPKRKKGLTKYHIVKPNETMWTISRDEGVRLAYLYKYNNMHAGEEPAAGEQINLRSKRKTDVRLATKSSTKPKENTNKSKTTDEKTTPVKTDKPVEFEDNNNDEFIDFESEEIEIKEEIKIAPAEEKVDEKVEIKEQTPVTAQPIYHTVAAKETLYGISKQYNVTVAQIQSWNSINDTNIKIGQQLIVGYK